MTPPLPPGFFLNANSATTALSNPQKVAEKIVVSEGVHTIGICKETGPGYSAAAAWVWRDLEDANEVTLNIDASQNYSNPAVCYLRGRLIYVDTKRDFTGLVVAEFDMSGTNLVQFSQGDKDSGNVMMLPLASGALLVAGCKNVGTQNLELLYRSSAGAWNYQFLTFSSQSNIPAFHLTMQQVANGEVYIFLNRDGGGTVELFRFSDTGSNVQLVQRHEGFLKHNGADGDMTPNGEYPWISSALDKHGRILLSYQNDPSVQACGLWTAKVVITAVTPGPAPGKEPVYVTNDRVERVFAQSPIFPGPDGVDLLLYEINPAQCGTRHWRMTRVLPGTNPPVIRDTETIPAFRAIMAWSPDGYCVYQDVDHGWVFGKLSLTQLRPKLKIERSGNTVTLSVDWYLPATDYDLEATAAIGGTWVNLGPWPVENFKTVQINGTQFFRLKKR